VAASRAAAGLGREHAPGSLRAAPVAAAIAALAWAAAPSGAAPAEVVASLALDVDGDGAADRVTLTAGGSLRVGDAVVQIAPAAERGELRAGRARPGGPAQIVAIVQRGAAREAVIVEPRVEPRGGWHEVARVTLGGVGLDGDEYSLEIDASPAGALRFQTRPEVRRCDGPLAPLFRERLERGAWRPAPAAVPALATPPTALAARRDLDPAPAPLVFTARAASHQAGARHAGELGAPRELDDGRVDTTWREDLAASAGEGQLFTLVARVPTAAVRELRVVPATDPRYNRPRHLVLLAARAAFRVELPDAAAEPRPPGAAPVAYAIELPPGAAPGCLTVVLESTYGPPHGTTAIAELAALAPDERARGGEAVLARAIAERDEGAPTAASALARRGAAAATALAAELAHASAPAARRRLVAALAKVTDPAAGPALARAAEAGWVAGPDLRDVIAALGRGGHVASLLALAARDALAPAVRVEAARQLRPTGSGLEALIALAGRGPTALRREVIERLAAAPAPALMAAASGPAGPAAAGDVWRALTRHARAHAAARPAAVAAMRAAWDSTDDYELRYRLVDGIAAHGDPADLAELAARLRALPAGPDAAALRQVAARAIAGAPRPAARPLVLALAADADPGVRLAAIAAIAAPDGALWEVDRAAAPAEGSGGAVDPPPAAAPPPPPSAAAAFDAALGDALARDAWPEVRRRSAAALGDRCVRAGPAAALAAAAARDPVAEVRGDALAALVQCRAPSASALLAQTWSDGAAPIALRSHAIELAVALGDPRLGATLLRQLARWRAEAITGPAPLALAQSAATAIGRLAPAGAAAALLATLDDSAFPELVSAAALGLAALGPACPPAARAKLRALARGDDASAPVARRAAAVCGGR
jgi:hypothetical protein